MDQDRDMFTNRPMRDEYLERIANSQPRRTTGGDALFGLIVAVFKMLPRSIRRFVAIVFALVIVYALFGQAIVAAVHR